MTPNSKKNSLKKTEKPSPINPTKSSNGWKETKMLKSKNIKLNKKKWKLSGTQSCKKSIKICHKDNLVQEECLECLVEWVECLEEWVECLVE